MREHFTVQRYAFGMCGRTPRETNKRPMRYVSDDMLSSSRALTDRIDLSPGDCSLETPDAPKYRPPSGRHHQSSPTDL